MKYSLFLLTFAGCMSAMHIQDERRAPLLAAVTKQAPMNREVTKLESSCPKLALDCSMFAYMVSCPCLTFVEDPLFFKSALKARGIVQSESPSDSDDQK